MSISIDFTDLFKANIENRNNSLNDTDIYQKSPSDKKISIKRYSSDNTHLNWVCKQLNDMNFGVNEGDLSESLSQCLYAILIERLHLQEQNQSLVSDCTRVRSQLDTLYREKEVLSSQLAICKQDLGFANSNISKMKADQRELRCTWLAEKSDLEGRCFHAQALNTKLLGTVKKKDKEYDNLQMHLTKIVKDTQRQQKSIITVSKPLPRNSSQARPQTLRDAELATAQDTIRELEAENKNLRLAVNELTASYANFQARVTTVMAAAQTRSYPLLAPAEASVVMSIEQSKPDSSNIAAAEAKNFPGRMRALADVTGQGSLGSANLGESNDLACKIVGDIGGQDAELELLRKRLQDAEAVIKEQDWLIHAALVGKLPSLSLSDARESDSGGFAESVCLSDDDDCDGFTGGTPRRKLLSGRASLGLIQSARRSSRRLSSNSTLSMDSPSFADFLPPASPETMRVLQEAGWPLPRAVTAAVTSTCDLSGALGLE